MPEGIDGSQSAGDEFGALQLKSLGELYSDQQQAARRVIEDVYRIASASFKDRSDGGRTRAIGGRTDAEASTDGYFSALSSHHDAMRIDAPIGADPTDFKRPHHVFTIDGKRGTGKTSVLLTLIPYLNALILSSNGAYSDRLNLKLADDLKTLDLPLISNKQRSERVALVLPIVFTEDMELQETTMEAVFALLEQVLDDADHQAGNDPDRKRSLQSLKNDLREKVGVGWTYSRKIGAETLALDALNYKDFVRKRAEIGRLAYTRLSMWRRFIDKYLDALNFSTLVLLFDDSDLNANLAEDLIRTIKMYLNHPRIVCLLAVDMRKFETTLLSRNLEFYQILRSRDGRSIDRIANNIINMEEDNTSALLEKVLPAPMRHRLALSGMSYVDHLFRSEVAVADDASNADMTLGSQGIFERWTRQRFAKAVERELAMSWWFLNGPYRRMIAGNLREVVAFRTATRNPRTPALDALLKRLRTGELSERSDSKLQNVPSLIESGVLNADITEDTYDAETATSILETDEKQFVDLWVDVALSAAQLDSGETQSAALSWIDAVVPSYNPQRSELRDHSALGVAELMDAELLPRNCLYMCHYRRLEPTVGADLPDPSPLSASLAALRDDDISLSNDDVIRTAEKFLGDKAITQDSKTSPSLIATMLDRMFVKSQLDLSEARLHEYALDVVVLLYASSRPNRGKSSGYATFVTVLKELSSADEGSQHENPIRDFSRRLRRGVCDFERRRQEALFTWACANEIAAAGDDNTEVEVQLVRDTLAEWARPTGGQKSLGPLQARMRMLIRRSATEAVVEKTRHGTLLAWSLAPLVETLYDFGSDYQRRASHDEWLQLQGFFKRVMAPFAIDRSVPDHEWLFPDFEDQTLKKITDEISAIDKTLAGLNLNDAAGSVTQGPNGMWRLKPERRLAYLLCTSERWVQNNLGIRT